MSFANLNRGPVLDADMRKLVQLDNLIREAERVERERAEREAEEARRQAEALRSRQGLTLDDLRRQRDELQATMLERETHVKQQAERDTTARLAERLAAEVQIDETRLAEKRNELAAVLSRLG